MICKKCGVAMETGTSYEGNGKWKRYCECPKCRNKIFVRDKNTQEKSYIGTVKGNNF